MFPTSAKSTPSVLTVIGLMLLGSPFRSETASLPRIVELALLQDGTYQAKSIRLCASPSWKLFQIATSALSMLRLILAPRGQLSRLLHAISLGIFDALTVVDASSGNGFAMATTTVAGRKTKWIAVCVSIQELYPEFCDRFAYSSRELRRRQVRMLEWQVHSPVLGMRFRRRLWRSIGRRTVHVQ